MLNTLRIENFTVFREANLKFSPGLNVIIGENGTGKSHLLKLGYAMLKTLKEFGDKAPARDVAERAFARNLVDIFRPEALGRLASRVQGSAASLISAKWGQRGSIDFSFSIKNTEKVTISSASYEELSSSTLFIPPKEILAIFEGFQGTLEKRELAFDGTYLDLTKSFNPSPLKIKESDTISNLIKMFEKAINASIIKKDNKFYFVSQSNNNQIEAQLAAEGHRKLGMLAYLILNGELRSNSSLFWDEPEANLNPRLLVKLAQILLELGKVMQVTIATHSLFLLRELEILQEQKELSNARYFGLHMTDNGVNVIQGNSSNEIGDIAALDASIKQATRYLQADGEM